MLHKSCVNTIAFTMHEYKMQVIYLSHSDISPKYKSKERCATCMKPVTLVPLIMVSKWIEQSGAEAQ